MKKLVFCTLFIASILSFSHARAGETVIYKDGDTELEGYWAPNACKVDNVPGPVVLIVHQWKGLGDYEKSRADMLANKCYNAFAVDVYGKGIRPVTNELAGQEATKYKNNPTLARRRMTVALQYAKSRAGVDPEKIAVMGYCFGGTMALELARSGANIKGAVSFHGGLGTKAPVTKPGIIKAALQIHHGAADPLVPPEEVTGFINEMNSAHADWMFSRYAGAVHSFTDKSAGNDPSDGVAYNAKADRRSWEGLLDFLPEIFEEQEGIVAPPSEKEEKE